MDSQILFYLRKFLVPEIVYGEGALELAVQAIHRMGGAIDLVILDLVMPEMDGGKVFDRIREIRADLPVLLSSGYSLNG